MNNIYKVSFIVIIISIFALDFYAKERIFPENLVSNIKIKRSPNNPLFDGNSREYDFPTVIKVPKWLPNPLGKYYMYNSTHGATRKGMKKRGSYLAYSDNLHGPWTQYKAGLNFVNNGEQIFNNPLDTSSPEITIDNENKQLILFVHSGALKKYKYAGQCSARLVSKDGINFTYVSKDVLFHSYPRIFEHEGQEYCIAQKGMFYRSKKDPNIRWEMRTRNGFVSGTRHVGLYKHKNILLIFHCKYHKQEKHGDTPEHILVSSVKLEGDWKTWKESKPISVLLPETEWEGKGYPHHYPKKKGGGFIKPKPKRTCNTRDPYIIKDDDGKLYMFYVGGEESCICVAEIEFLLDGEKLGNIEK